MLRSNENEYEMTLTKSRMGKGWLYGYEVMQEWGITDLTLMQWLLDGLPAYSPNSLRKVEKHIIHEEAVMSFCEWTTGTAFRTYSLEGLRIRLFNLVFRRSDLEAAMAGPRKGINRATDVREAKSAGFADRKKITSYIKDRLTRITQISRTTTEKPTRKGNLPRERPSGKPDSHQ